MDDDWLEAIRTTLPEPAAPSAQAAATVVVLDDVRPQRSAEGRWSFAGADGPLAELADDDAFLEPLRLEWAGPVHIGGSLWLCRGHWLRVEGDEERSAVADAVAAMPRLDAHVQQERLDRLVEMLPASGVQELAQR